MKVYEIKVSDAVGCVSPSNFLKDYRRTVSKNNIFSNDNPDRKLPGTYKR